MPKSIHEDIDALYRHHGLGHIRDRSRVLDRKNIPMLDPSGRRVDQPEATKRQTLPHDPVDPHPVVFWETNPDQ